jgi:hypothetical protein
MMKRINDSARKSTANIGGSNVDRYEGVYKFESSRFGSTGMAVRPSTHRRRVALLSWRPRVEVTEYETSSANDTR